MLNVKFHKLFFKTFSQWLCNECGGAAMPGYSDMANGKVAEAIAKLEEEGLTPARCEKFLKTYSKVLFIIVYYVYYCLLLFIIVYY